MKINPEGRNSQEENHCLNHHRILNENPQLTCINIKKNLTESLIINYELIIIHIDPVHSCIHVQQ